jgi:transcriptional regulator with XRE-family HTH domain
MPASSPRHADNPALVALGAAIRRARLDQGMSQEELASKSEIDRAYMSSIERGKQNPGIISVLGIAAALQTTAGELLMQAGL